jgi:hypothetical protein
MRGRGRSVDLLFDPEIEKTAKANRKVIRLSKFVPSSPRTGYTCPTPSKPESISSPKSNTMGDVDPPPRPKLGDYGSANSRGRLTHVFQPANLVAFAIKTSVQNGLKDRQFDESYSMSPHGHLNHFFETCELCVSSTTVTDDQKKLMLFAFTLTGKAKDWLLTLPSGTIQTWDELELKFLERYFPMSKYWEKKHEISNFRQGECELLYDAWERFNLLLKRCLGHKLSEKQYLQIFTKGLTHNNMMFLDASAGGSMRVKTDHEVQTLIENMPNMSTVMMKEKGVFLG